MNDTGLAVRDRTRPELRLSLRLIKWSACAQVNAVIEAIAKTRKSGGEENPASLNRFMLFVDEADAMQRGKGANCG